MKQPDVEYVGKSRFFDFVKCNRFYQLKVQNPSEHEEPLYSTKTTQINLKKHAKKLFDGLIEYPIQGYAKDIAYTKELLANYSGGPLFRPAFAYENLVVYIDFLEQKNDKWYAYVVRNALRPSRKTFEEIELKQQILAANGIELKEYYLVLLNGSYVEGESAPKKLFQKMSVKKSAKRYEALVHNQINAFLEFCKPVQKLVPPVLKEHCIKPEMCPYFEHCFSKLEANSVFYLPMLSKYEKIDLYSSGEHEVHSAIPLENARPQTNAHIQSVEQNEAIVNRKELKKYFTSLKYPIAFIDFEFFSSAIPRYKGVKPFDSIPYEFSLQYIEREGEEPICKDYLVEPPENPYAKLAEELYKVTQDINTLIAFDKKAEVRILRELGNHAPQHKEHFSKLQNNIIDLYSIFSNYTYYHYSFQGKLSLKQIETHFLEHSEFNELSLNAGALANAVYDNLFDTDDEAYKARAIQDLRDYCNADTHSMYLVFQQLMALIDAEN